MVRWLGFEIGGVVVMGNIGGRGIRGLGLRSVEEVKGRRKRELVELSEDERRDKEMARGLKRKEFEKAESERKAEKERERGGYPEW